MPPNSTQQQGLMANLDLPQILWQHKDGIALNKPSGYLTRPEGRAPDVPDCLSWAQKKLNRPFQLVHRLDRGTSGVLLLAADSESAAQWSKKFEARGPEGWRKTYFALAQKSPGPSLIRIDEPIEGKRSVTQFESLRSGRHPYFGEIQLISARPLTGRTHQIRIHALHGGFPILGDTRYRGMASDRIYLHAFALETKGLRIQAPLPAAFQRILQESQIGCEAQWLAS